MSETTFSKGDRVKVTANGPPFTARSTTITKGARGTVKRTRESTFGKDKGLTRVTVDHDDPNYGSYFYHPEHLEHLPDPDDEPELPSKDRLTVIIAKAGADVNRAEYAAKRILDLLEGGSE